jgi:transcriptional regulator with XRE-family HTH domain
MNADPERSRAFGRSLRQRRVAVDPAVRRLGPYPRRPERVGRRVTQEEFAEAIGVSREWYSRLENGTMPRTSADLIQKIALAFELDESERLQLIAFGIDDVAAANARFKSATAEGILDSVSQLRRFVQRVTLCSSFAEAAELAVETIDELLRSDCVTVMMLQDAGGVLTGYATGPRSRYWTPLCTRITHEIYAPLRDGGIGIVESAPSDEELAGRLEMSLACVRRNGEDRPYEYECEVATWHEWHDRLQGHSGIAIPLFEGEFYRGVLGVGWLQPRQVAELAIEVARTTATIVELAAAKAVRPPL